MPLSKVNHPSIKKLFEVHMNRRIYDRTYLTRAFTPRIYNDMIDKIRNYVGDNYVYFIIDEVPDIKFRGVVNVLVGILNGTYSKPFLLIQGLP